LLHGGTTKGHGGVLKALGIRKRVDVCLNGCKGLETLTLIVRIWAVDQGLGNKKYKGDSRGKKGSVGKGRRLGGGSKRAF